MSVTEAVGAPTDSRPTNNKDPYVSFVIPTYNEEQRLPSTLERLSAFTSSLAEPSEIIIVDDGSVDGTRGVVQRAMAAHPTIRLIENPHSGKAYTLRTGMEQARGQYLISVDADLSTPPAEFLKLIDVLQSGYDIAVGSRSGRPGAPWYRLIISNGWRFLVSTLLAQDFNDTQCGFKGYRTQAVQEILKRAILYSTPAESLTSARVTAAWDVEILYIARKLGCKIEEVPLEWTHVGGAKMRPTWDSLQAFVDLLKIRWLSWQGRYDAPAHAASQQTNGS